MALWRSRLFSICIGIFFVEFSTWERQRPLPFWLSLTSVVMLTGLISYVYQVWDKKQTVATCTAQIALWVACYVAEMEILPGPFRLRWSLFPLVIAYSVYMSLPTFARRLRKAPERRL